jgi:hypothetical protein
MCNTLEGGAVERLSFMDRLSGMAAQSTSNRLPFFYLRKSTFSASSAFHSGFIKPISPS